MGISTMGDKELDKILFRSILAYLSILMSS